MRSVSSAKARSASAEQALLKVAFRYLLLLLLTYTFAFNQHLQAAEACSVTNLTSGLTLEPGVVGTLIDGDSLLCNETNPCQGEFDSIIREFNLLIEDCNKLLLWESEVRIQILVSKLD